MKITERVKLIKGVDNAVYDFDSLTLNITIRPRQDKQTILILASKMVSDLMLCSSVEKINVFSPEK